MAKTCDCTGPEDVICLVLMVNGKEQGRTVAARVCPTCGKHYLAPMASLVFLLTRVKELTLKPKAPGFAETLEGYLQDIPKKEGD